MIEKSEIRKLEDEFKRQKESLQNNCSHDELEWKVHVRICDVRKDGRLYCALKNNQMCVHCGKLVDQVDVKNKKGEIKQCVLIH